jgi:hypothetical protein
MLLLIEAAHALFDWLGPELDVEGLLDDLLGDAWHFSRSPHKHILVVSEEVDELDFLFGAQFSPDLAGLGQVLSVNLDSLGILGSLEGIRCGGNGWIGQKGRCTEAQLI